MTKQELQKELLEKVKLGTKPSHLKKLKRSKSAGDIPKAPPLPTATSDKEIAQLKEQVKFHAETAQNYLQSLQISQAKVSELEEQLKNNLPTNTELDQSLMARHQNLKDWFSQYQKTKHLDKELSENIDEASEELIKQDNLISNLRSENRSLKRDLQLTSRLAESRKVPYYSPEDNGTYLKYALYSLLAVGFTLWLVRNLKITEKQ